MPDDDEGLQLVDNTADADELGDLDADETGDGLEGRLAEEDPGASDRDPYEVPAAPEEAAMHVVENP